MKEKVQLSTCLVPGLLTSSSYAWGSHGSLWDLGLLATSPYV